jgi:Ca-activated chloride channel family protein
VVAAVIETLGDEDRIELIEFGSAPVRWREGATAATRQAKREAINWVKALRASGATEMRTAIIEALRTVRQGAQRQVILVTDGQIGFERQVVEEICDRLPASSRLHTVGVGSAVNRSLTGPAARAGHGVEVVVGIGEDPEKAAQRLAARTGSPLLVDLSVGGSALVERAPSRLPDLFGQAPALLGLSLRPEGGELVLRGRTPEGGWEQRIQVEPVAEGTGNEAIAALFGREKVEDLEMRLAAGGSAGEIEREIERVGIEHRISTRLTSWIAVSEERTVDPNDPRRSVRQPHELPFGMSAEGLGLRPAFDASLQTRAGTLSPGAFREMARRMTTGAPPAKIDLKARLGSTVAPAAPMAQPRASEAPGYAKHAPLASYPPPAELPTMAPRRRYGRPWLTALVVLFLLLLPIVLWLLFRR